MEALHDVVKAGKARYIGASAMYAYAWQFLKALNVTEKNGWTRYQCFLLS
jgi:aryl-alcohol dehydrogenase-like predicted oxidoreductase